MRILSQDAADDSLRSKETLKFNKNKKLSQSQWLTHFYFTTQTQDNGSNILQSENPKKSTTFT